MVREAGAEDADTIARFVHALLDELSGGAAPPVNEVAERALAVLARPDVHAALAVVDGEPVGAMTLNECAAIYAGGAFGEISELYVLPEMRSLGVAQKLLDHACAVARRRGWKRLEVGAPAQPAWSRTLDFYLRNGFAEVGPRLRRPI